MAAEVVVGAALGAFLNALFDRMASERFVNFITRQKLDDGLLDRLKDAIKSVQGVLDDAEEKEITKPTVKEWLDKLKNAFFEADDLLDKIDYEATRLKCEAESRSTIDDVLEFICPPESFTKGLTDILETIEHLVREKDEHGLREKDEYDGLGKSTERIPTTSVVETSEIFGRVRDREAIMKLLLSDDVNRSNNLSIISIVGLGGIGKTTLAKFIYNDERVRNRFRDRGWVCVSEKFDFRRIATDIAKSVAQIDCNNKTLDKIQVELKENSTGKRLLLVLDDVWNENFNYWEQLLTPLKSGGPGSTIIITTRNDDVASTLRSSSRFPLGKLDSTDCWQLFCKYAFDDQERLNDYRDYQYLEDNGYKIADSYAFVDKNRLEDYRHYQHLEDIGRKIVEKCDGLPLAVKIMAGVLSYKRDARDWEKVLKNDLWEASKDDILPVLRLSYCYLPSYLKQCFAYCSIFPKAYSFNKKQLILWWMAEGFLIEQEGKWTMEELGEKYFEALVSRSFFQRVDNSIVMHDLINDLARVVAGDFCFRFENQDSCIKFDKLRYFSCVAVKGESSPRQLLSSFKSCHLRTFLPLDTKWELQEVIPDLFHSQRRLRVLSLSRYKNLVDLPSSFSHLKQHLRYLDLSFTSIKSLPECLCSFYKLQSLNLFWCMNLASLPTKLGSLINMRHLDIEGTKVQVMPPNMGKLIKLHTLTDFYVGKGEGCGIKELGSLRQLGGTLRIHNLQHLVNASDALEAKIKCKENLKELYLYWEGDNGEQHRDEAVLDGLQPHENIKVFSVDGYGGTSLPAWLESGGLPGLKEQWVISCQNLKALPSNFCPSKLEISNCPEIETFSRISLPLGLESLTISNCSKLIAGRMDWDLHSIASLHSFIIKDFEAEEMECFPEETLLPSTLTSLEICNLPYLKYLNYVGLRGVDSLKYLTIKKCHRLQLVPNEGLPSTDIHVSSSNLIRLNRRSHGLTHLRKLWIEECPEIASLPQEVLPPILNTLDLHNLQNLRSVEGSDSLFSLERLTISGCPHLKTLDLPSSLSFLSISGCPLVKIKRKVGERSISPKFHTFDA